MSYRYIYTEYRLAGVIKFLLIDNGIDTYRSLARLAVANHQFPLATANRDHCIDCFDTGLQWLIYRLPIDNTRCLALDRHFIRIAHDRAFAIDRLTQCIHHTPQHTLAYLDRGNFIGTAHGGTFDVVVSSPEALVKVTGRRSITHPIAGSRPRGKSPEEDRLLEEDLLADPKERAEHVMLVDLGRNDLQRVCSAGTVDVVEFMNVRRYSHVTHLESTVVGDLAPGATAYDVLRATFPAGTLSGAPKPRALTLIEHYEPSRRGIYGGVVGYLDFHGDLDMAIAIRTAVVKDGTAHVQAGAGIVADSVPSSEYDETVNKAAAALRAVATAAALRTVE